MIERYSGPEHGAGGFMREATGDVEIREGAELVFPGQELRDEFEKLARKGKMALPSNTKLVTPITLREFPTYLKRRRLRRRNGVFFHPRLPIQALPRILLRRFTIFRQDCIGRTRHLLIGVFDLQGDDKGIKPPVLIDAEKFGSIQGCRGEW